MIGREWPSEEEIVESLDWRDKYITATFVKKSSDYVKIMPMDGARNASNINHPNQLERMIVHDRLLWACTIIVGTVRVERATINQNSEL